MLKILEFYPFSFDLFQIWIRHLHSAVPLWRRTGVPTWSSARSSALLPARQLQPRPHLRVLVPTTTTTTTCPTSGNRRLFSSKSCRWVAPRYPMSIIIISLNQQLRKKGNKREMDDNNKDNKGPFSGLYSLSNYLSLLLQRERDSRKSRKKRKR